MSSKRPTPAPNREPGEQTVTSPPPPPKKSALEWRRCPDCGCKWAGVISTEEDNLRRVMAQEQELKQALSDMNKVACVLLCAVVVLFGLFVWMN